MGDRTYRCIAWGMVRANLVVVGTEVEVDVYGRRHKAIVQEDAPLWDPSNERIKA